jgi:hypothetical protein
VRQTLIVTITPMTGPRAHLQPFLDPYNYARRLKTLRGLTPYEFICKPGHSRPAAFRGEPTPHPGTEQLIMRPA